MAANPKQIVNRPETASSAPEKTIDAIPLPDDGEPSIVVKRILNQYAKALEGLAR